ncbi:MAG: UDP-N-acetylmuramoyl-L-alanyl-D-glutamate--2,6-diaminopimelate ligase [Pseudomonadota bacterium]
MDIKALKGITQDSRAVKDGYLFAAFPGKKSDGRDFISAAIEHGACAVLGPEGTQLPAGAKNIELITDENPRKVFAHMAAKFYGSQPEHMVAVTGTNGKTSVVTFVEQLWAASGYKASSMGTIKGNMTTPDPVALHAQLADLSAAGVTHLAMEASSHGLDQYRLDGVEIEAAGFTNLSHDHLDYHGSIDAYFEAKARLFSEILKPKNDEEKWAVLNADSSEFGKLETLCLEHGVKVMSYGHKGKDLKILSIKPTANGQKLELGVLGTHRDITLPLVGEFQVMNALCALGLVIAKDPKNKAKYAQALEKIQGARGRLQHVAGHPKNAAVYVDYAHTPDALENVLKALRPHTEGKLVCVFGCGGDRDKAKRPVMGDVAHTHADEVIVTDDNPRSENPADIRAAILRTAQNAKEIGDRRRAIEHAILNLQERDVLVIAGKGHEQGQVFADRTDPFDDVEEAEKIIQQLNDEV